MKKRGIQLLAIACLFVLPMQAAESFSDVHTRQLQMRYNRLKKYNKWFLKDLYYAIKPNIKNVYNLLAAAPSTLLHTVIPHHIHEQQEALVRFTHEDDIGSAEKMYLSQRKRNTHQALEQFLGKSVDVERQPRIAMCFSGGGIRATMLTLGFLIGAQDTGLLDCTTYISGLSGSTWVMAPWLATKKNLSIIRNEFGDKLAGGIHHLTRHADRKQVIKQLLTKAWYRQFVSAIDIYGPLLANTLLPELGDRKHTITLSDSHEHIAQGRYPMPIYTCISTNKQPYEWFEVTPFEMGSSYLHAYIPTWAHGRKFKHGHSVNCAPEQSLGYYMGIFGSAFEVDIEDAIRLSAEAIQEFKDGIPSMFGSAVDNIISGLVNSPLDDVRLAPSMLPNFVYKTETTPFADSKTLSLVDAGIDFNLPFPPLLRAARDVDVIIVYDASAGRIGFDLECAAEYAKRKGLKFPPVPDNLGDHLCSVLQDPNDPACPIVIYFPRIKNEVYSATFDPAECIKEDYCNTFNFKYGQKDIDELSGLSEFACHQFIDTIKQVIAQVAVR